MRDFGAWNEVNHKTQETWDHPGHAASYFKSMYRAVRKRCRSCAVVGLDILDQTGVERYIRSFYRRLSPTWRKRLTVVGIHNYSDVNRNRSSGTSRIIRAVRRYNRRAKFWFTETGALASFGRAFRYSESRQASRMKNMFSFASRYRTRGVQRVYSYNFFGIENGGCGSTCRFDAGLVARTAARARSSACSSRGSPATALTRRVAPGGRAWTRSPGPLFASGVRGPLSSGG